jgi:hypothetical protein
MERHAKIDEIVGMSLLDNPYIGQKKQVFTDEDELVKIEEEKLNNFKSKEKVATKVLAHLPINEKLYNNQLAHVGWAADQRAEQEKNFLEIKIQENDDFAEEGDMHARRQKIKDRLKFAMETEEAKDERVYSLYDGFFLYIDFLLHMPRYFDKCY